MFFIGLRFVSIRIGKIMLKFVFIWLVYWIALINVLGLAQRNDFSRWSTKILCKLNSDNGTNTENPFLCDATLVSYKAAVTTCECATQTDFIFPEFYKRNPSQCVVTTRGSELDDGYEYRGVKKFVLHPKCTSHNKIAGLFNYNYAVAHLAKPFNEHSHSIVPIDLPIFDYDVVNYTLWKALDGPYHKCEILGWDPNYPYGIVVTRMAGCEEELCGHLGNTCPLGLEEKGMLCLKANPPVDPIPPDYDDAFKRGGKWADKSQCSKEVLSGSPLVCFGFIMGVTAPGLCRIDVPVIVSRIEPALEFIYQQVERDTKSKALIASPLIEVILFFLTTARSADL